MATKWWIAGAVALFGAGCAGQLAKPTEEDMQKAWMECMTPGEPHARMARHAGEWTVAGKMWMSPDAPPTDTTGKATIKMIFGGRYQVQEYESNFMGMPFQGMSITGYDNVRKVWFSTWIDSMGTGEMTLEGQVGEDGAFVLEGEMPDPMGDEYDVKMVEKEMGPDTLLFEMYMKGPQWPQGGKMMELTYKRVKK